MQQPPRLRRVGRWAVLVPALLALTACSATTQEEWERGAMPEGAAEHSASIITFWQWTWVTALIVGVFVWGLILFAAIKYRRRHEDEVPVQTRYNLPMELLYTVAPVVVVLVFFKYVIDTQNEVPYNNEGGETDHVVTVVGQQWSWTFNYIEDPALDGQTTVYQDGNPQDLPTLYLPVNESVQFRLRSPDVVHSFWVPAFTYKLDVIPGSITNDFNMTPTREGTFEGRCAELCGTYHSRMLFDVKVVSAEEFAEHLRELEAKGNTGEVIGQEAPTGTNEEGLEDSESGANE